MEPADRELFEQTVRRAAERASGGSLDAALDEVGWRDALSSDPRDAITVLFSQQGFFHTTSDALDDVLLAGLGLQLDGTAAVLLPPAGEWTPPGELDGDRLVVRGIATSTSTARESAVVVAAARGQEVAAAVPLAELEVRPVRGVDPAYGLAEVTGEVSTSVETVDWTSALAAGQLALSHELVGASRKMLALAREHALNRTQFGQPISGFQAIRHRLADTLLAIESADALLDAAWIDQTPRSAAMAKALTGRSARTAMRHCQQVLAGIGFTTEHSLHHYIRRVLLLEQLLGSSRALTEAQGRRLIADRRLPPLLPL